MNKTHNIKVEEDIMGRKFPCTLCPYTTRNMDELKDHLITQHKKDEHNWMVEEIIAVYTCDECELDFPTMSQLESHGKVIHKQDGIPNQKNAKDLHLQTEHNIKTFKAPPAPNKHSTTRTSIKCGVCSFVCKSGPSMKNIQKCFTIMIQPMTCPKKKRGKGIVIIAPAATLLLSAIT